MSAKPALLIYKDGRIHPNGRVYDRPHIALAEMWPLYTWQDCPECQGPHTFPIMERQFRFLGEAGPYAIYAEVQ